MKTLVQAFIEAANACDIDRVLALFQSGAVIDDVSVGQAFVGDDGIRRYFEQFFVGYNTVSRLLSVVQADDRVAVARVDFTGDFGHEVGMLKVQIDAQGLIVRIDADLE